MGVVSKTIKFPVKILLGSAAFVALGAVLSFVYLFEWAFDANEYVDEEVQKIYNHNKHASEILD